MYSMVIADDEVIARKRLELFIRKEFPDIDIVGLASDGLELVSMTEQLQPDIAIVDVNMPGVSGIDAIDMLNVKKRKTRYIVNTAYSEFEYVKRALDLKVDAYLLKPDKSEHIIESIQKVCRIIDELKAEEENKLQYKTLFREIQPVLENEIMFSIYVRESCKESLNTFCDMYGIQVEKAAVVTLIPESGENYTFDKMQVRKELTQILGGFCNHVDAVMENSIGLLILSEKDRVQEQLEGWLRDILEILLSNLEESPGIRMRAGVGRFYRDSKEYYHSYQQSMLSLQNAVGNRISFDCDSRNDLVHDSEKMQESGSEIAIEEQNLHPCVRDCISYVQEHFGERISLESVADEIGISPYYLSRLMSNDLGITFIEYLTELRMNKATQLAVETKLTIREIAEKTGYANETYFCRVYKKYMGKTIGEIRRNSR